MTPDELRKWARPIRGDAPATCGVPGCDNPHKTQNLCGAHYYRLNLIKRRTGELRKAAPAHVLLAAIEPLEDQDRPPCNVPGCKKLRHVRGLCKAHYTQYRRLQGLQ
jgi:hypothetical protein